MTPLRQAVGPGTPNMREGLTQVVNIALALFRVIEENVARQSANLAADQWEALARESAADYQKWYEVGHRIAGLVREAESGGTQIENAAELMRACNWARIAGTEVEATISAIGRVRRGESGIPLEGFADELQGGAVAGNG